MKNIKYVVQVSVRAFLISVLLPVLGCDKVEDNYEDPALIRIIPGGCATDATKSDSNGPNGQDQVTYTINKGTLDLLVGFNGTCCGEYGTSSSIKNDTIFIEIKTTQIGMCDCICYYTYSFTYSGITKSYSYSVNVDDYLLFEGSILQ